MCVQWVCVYDVVLSANSRCQSVNRAFTRYFILNQFNPILLCSKKLLDRKVFHTLYFIIGLLLIIHNFILKIPSAAA